MQFDQLEPRYLFDAAELELEQSFELPTQDASVESTANQPEIRNPWLCAGLVTVGCAGLAVVSGAGAWHFYSKAQVKPGDLESQTLLNPDQFNADSRKYARLLGIGVGVLSGSVCEAVGLVACF